MEMLLFPEILCPGWSGMMQQVQDGSHRGQSSIMFLPMIDMKSTDITCLSSTLNYVSSHCKTHNITEPVITFDQPLWWKAYTIIYTEPQDSDLRNIVVRLGPFHTEMNFVGAIGHLMVESGLKELLELIYAPNAV